MSIYAIVAHALLAYWGYKIAKKQGRNAELAALLSFVFGLITIICYYIAGNKKKNQE